MSEEVDLNAKGVKIQKLGGGEFEKFAQQVVKQLIEDNVAPTPNNYSIYFEKLLETKAMAFKKRVNEMMSFEKEDQNNKIANIEQDIKLTFSSIKQLVGTISMIYKNIVTIKTLIKNKTQDLKISNSSLAVQSILKTLDNDVNKLTSALDIQLNSIKQGYEEITTIYTRVDEQSEFDDKFGVFNKRYLLKNVKKDLDDINKYGYSVSLLFLRIKDELLESIQLQKDRILLMRNAAKLLLKTSRRSDVVAHYGDGIFVMEMMHTDIVSAKKACERVSDLFYNTTFFIDDKEINMDIEMSVCSLKEGNLEEQFIKAINILSTTGKDSEYFAVVEDNE